LGPYVKGFCAELAAQGYTPLSASNQVRLMAHVSRWMLSRRLTPGDLTPQRVEQFLKARCCAGYTAWLSERGMAPLLGYLRRLRVVPEPAVPEAHTALDRLLERYGHYLLHERGLVTTSIRQAQDVARRFLAACCDPEKLVLYRLRAADVTGFVLRESRKGYSVGSTKLIVTYVRSLLRYLYLEGHTPTALATAAPPVAGWRLSSLPRALAPEQVAALLHSCDRRTAIGRRNYVILILMVRLGLRAGEVAAIELGDLDWRSGEILIRGKGRQQDRLPLPVDVGEALVAYLRRGRPRIADRHLFLRSRAPHGALLPSGVSAVVIQAGHRAQVPGASAHRLRHTAATQMLRQGASLPEIAQLLRHRSLLTTAIYAKVDRAALRGLAQPWPGPNDQPTGIRCGGPRSSVSCEGLPSTC